MGLQRKRRLALLAAVVAALAGAQQAAAAGRSTITFDPAQQNGGVLVFAGGGSADSGQSIDVRTLPSTNPLPRRLSIEVPSGYRVDVGAAPGTVVAQAGIGLFAVDSPSFSNGLDDLVAKNPLDYAADPAAQACAPGTHAAVWHASIALATQHVDVTVFVDPGGADGAGYTLQACPSGLSPGTSRLVADISLSGIAPLTPPAARGEYLWHAYVAPDEGQTYELQALVPLPESVTLRATHDRKGRVAHLTGRVVEAGKPVSGAFVLVDSPSSDREPLEGRTRADGTFSFRTTIKRTTQFDVSVFQGVDPCTGGSSAPGGCLSRITVPPDTATTTVWVSPHGGAVRATRPADQRTAEREDLKPADLPDGFADAGSTDARLACENPTHESDLTITGESSSPAFLAEGTDDQHPSLAFLHSHVRVFRTVKQAQAALRREAVLKTARCEFADFRGKTRKIKPVRLPAAARVRAFRVVLASGAVSAYADTIFLQRGRSLDVVVFLGAGDGKAVERPLVRKLAARLR